MLRNPFSMEKRTFESPLDMVIYRSRLNAKINRNFEVFTAAGFLAAITQHIPDKGGFFAISVPGTIRLPACPLRALQGPIRTNPVTTRTRCRITRTC